MKFLKSAWLASVFLVTMVVHAPGQVFITGYGTGDYTSTFTSGFTKTQTATTLELSGNDTSSEFGSIATPVNVTGNTTSLQLRASYSNASTSTSNFDVELFDASGNGLIYQGNLNNFTPRGSNVTLSLVSLGEDPNNLTSFNGTVSSLGFLTGGTGLASLDLTLDQLSASATPEPSTYALLIIGGLAIVGGTRALRKAKVSA